jgi:ABC-type Fe3+ transport system permease subunit
MAWLLLGAVVLALLGGNKKSTGKGKGRSTTARGRSSKGTRGRAKRKSGCGPIFILLILLCAGAVYVWASHPEMLPPSMR